MHQQRGYMASRVKLFIITIQFIKLLKENIIQFNFEIIKISYMAPKSNIDHVISNIVYVYHFSIQFCRTNSTKFVSFVF